MLRSNRIEWFKSGVSEDSDKVFMTHRFDRSRTYCITECKSKVGSPTLYLAQSVHGDKMTLISREYSFAKAKRSVSKHCH